jgi:hypothetical protein
MGAMGVPSPRPPTHLQGRGDVPPLPLLGFLFKAEVNEESAGMSVRSTLCRNVPSAEIARVNRSTGKFSHAGM